MFWVQVCAAEYVNQLISTCCSVLFCFFSVLIHILKLVKSEVAHIFNLIVVEYLECKRDNDEIHYPGETPSLTAEKESQLREASFCNQSFTEVKC